MLACEVLAILLYVPMVCGGGRQLHCLIRLFVFAGAIFWASPLVYSQWLMWTYHSHTDKKGVQAWHPHVLSPQERLVSGQVSASQEAHLFKLGPHQQFSVSTGDSHAFSDYIMPSPLQTPWMWWLLNFGLVLVFVVQTVCLSADVLLSSCRGDGCCKGQGLLLALGSGIVFVLAWLMLWPMIRLVTFSKDEAEEMLKEASASAKGHGSHGTDPSDMNINIHESVLIDELTKRRSTASAVFTCCIFIAFMSRWLAWTFEAVGALCQWRASKFGSGTTYLALLHSLFLWVIILCQEIIVHHDIANFPSLVQLYWNTKWSENYFNDSGFLILWGVCEFTFYFCPACLLSFLTYCQKPTKSNSE